MKSAVEIYGVAAVHLDKPKATEFAGAGPSDRHVARHISVACEDGSVLTIRLYARDEQSLLLHGRTE